MPRSFPLLAIAASALLLAAVIFVMLDRRQEAHWASRRAGAGEAAVLSQRLAAQAPRAAAGDTQAFAGLERSGQRFAEIVQALTPEAGARELGAQAQPAQAGAAIAALKQRWLGIEAELRRVLQGRAAVNEMTTQQQALAGSGQRLAELLQRLSATAAEQRLDAPLGAQVRSLEARLANARLASRDPLVSPEPRDAAALAALGADLDAAQASLAALASERSPTPTREHAEALRAAFTPYANAVKRLAELAQPVAEARRGAVAIATQSDALLEAATGLIALYPRSEQAASHYIWAAFVAAALAFLCLLWTGKVVLDDAERRAAESLKSAARSRQANERTQDAILRLLDEMGNLARGDLTVRASVTDELTGAIADAINHAVAELRRLVIAINAAASGLAEACSQAQAISGELLNASQRQAQEIAAASASVAAVTASVMQVSDRAVRSAQVAGTSLEAAAAGSGSVRRSVAGIETIRTQMQDTAKRIKRLGESSQEIGEIVDLIADITERTNTLAVNAALQASAAGAAGRGFGQVAEEVQRLAGHSARAAQQIGAIVRTIQADTQDATSAVERCTERVVGQTGLAYAAGEALTHIEQVSGQLAGLIGAISQTTGEQRETAERIHAGMADILRITQITTDGSRNSADRAAQLAGLARELERSVAGFRLS
jgi:twitching motility protein PilJ